MRNGALWWLTWELILNICFRTVTCGCTCLFFLNIRYGHAHHKTFRWSNTDVKLWDVRKSGKRACVALSHKFYWSAWKPARRLRISLLDFKLSKNKLVLNMVIHTFSFIMFNFHYIGWRYRYIVENSVKCTKNSGTVQVRWINCFCVPHNFLKTKLSSQATVCLAYKA